MAVVSQLNPWRPKLAHSTQPTTALTNFEFGEYSLRTLQIDGHPWFVAADVCKVLEHTNPTMALNALDEDERAKFNLGRQGETNIVNEPGLYTLILGSRKPEAKTFKRWVTHEVLPTIRKTGSYSANGAHPTTPLALYESVLQVHLRNGVSARVGAGAALAAMLAVPAAREPKAPKRVDMVAKIVGYVSNARHFVGDTRFGPVCAKGEMPRGKLVKLMHMPASEAEHFITEALATGLIEARKTPEGLVYVLATAQTVTA